MSDFDLEQGLKGLRNYTSATIVDFLVSILNFLAVIITITIAFGLVMKSEESLTATILAGFLAVYFFALVIFTVFREFQMARKKRYSEAMEDLHNCSHTLRDAWYALTDSNNQGLAMAKIEAAIKHFSTAFSMITGVKCHACIKTIHIDRTLIVAGMNKDRAMYVTTTLRSADRSHEKSIDDKDWISDNSDFLTILLNNARCFHSNNLLNRPGYQNSHWTENMRKEKRVPYVSTIVWPIRKMLYEDEKKTPDLIGFLCIDSKSRNVFNMRYDFGVGAAFADYLYVIFKTLKDTPKPQGKMTDRA